jgi:uncharacterized protein (TIGR03790 family)
MRSALFTIAVSCCLVPAAQAQTAENVAVVINDASPASQKIGEYYATKRAIPQSNVLRIRTSTDETVPRAVYARTIEGPIASALARGSLLDRVLYLVLTKGVPIRIEGTGDANGTVASVDSELTLLYRRATGVEVPIAGRMDNPFYLGARDPVQPPLFGHRDHDIYLVTRLDAFTVEEALALVDRGLAPRTDGQIVLDLQDKLVNRTGEDWLETAAERLKSRGHTDRVLLEPTVKGVRDVSAVLGYYSWGSNDPRNRTRKYGLGFVPGSIAATFVSSDARTFREPPADWVPSGDTNRSTWFAGTPQSLIGDLIREGVTGVAGHVAEPYLQSTIRPEILFPMYLSGANLAEAFYAAMPHLSWQTVVIGDPLCAPFRKRSTDRAEIESGIDAETTLPAYFSKRRIARGVAQAPGAPERAVVLSVRGEALMSRGDTAAARTAFEEATKLSSELWQADLQLALLYEQAGQSDAAIARYRRVIATQPRAAIALNNLAYRLAIEKKDLKEALSLATQAVKLVPTDASVLDTLAWIQHLQGDNAAAVKTIAAALKAGTDIAEIRLHAAVINAAAGARAVAQDNLSEALRLNPALDSSAEAKQVRQMLAK